MKKLNNQEMNKIFREIYQGIDIEKVAREELEAKHLEKKVLKQYEDKLNYDLKFIKEHDLEAYIKVQYLIKLEANKTENKLVSIESEIIRSNSVMSYLLGITPNIFIQDDYTWESREDAIKTTVVTTGVSYFPTLVEYIKSLFNITKTIQASNLSVIIIQALNETEEEVLSIAVGKEEIFDLIR